MTSAPSKPDLRQLGEEAFAEVLRVLLALPVSRRNPANDPSPAGVPDQIISTVPLVGPRLSVSVCLHLPTPFVAHAVRLLAGIDAAAPDADALLDDTAGELANMVAGRLAAQLAARGYPAALGTPSVSRRVGVPSPNQPGADRELIELSCAGQRLSLELQCRYVAL